MRTETLLPKVRRNKFLYCERDCCFFMPFLLFILFSAIFSFASDVATDSLSQGINGRKNIPLPRQTAYTGKGLSIGIAGGVYNPTDDCDCVGNWQGQLEYFYTPTISAGMDVRFLGGDLDSDVMIMYQRYRLNMRFHKVFENLDMYLEPVFGLENTSISEFREQVSSHKTGNRLDGWSSSLPQDTIENDSIRGKCEKMFSLDGFSLGVGLGLGYRINELWGLTGSALLEYNFARAVQLTLTPGVALNLQRVWPWAKENLRSTWLSLEVGTQRFFNRGVTEWASFLFVGFQIGV